MRWSSAAKISGAAAAVAACMVSTPRAETVKDREGAVRGDRVRMEENETWIYNDIERSFDEARREGKPLLVVLRCVPCLACAGMDAEILEAPRLDRLMDRFVRARVINANAIDLALFQFDYDLSLSILFFHGDGTVLGRYGSWTHQKDPGSRATAGLEEALRRVLALHENIDEHRSGLAAKRGPAPPYPTPLEMPALEGRYQADLDWKGNVVGSCVHCHQIGDAIRREQRAETGTIAEKWIFPFPSPETIGLQMAADRAASVERVEPDSPAAAAGLQAGDELVSMAGQPLVSAADASWALHHAPAEGTLDVTVRRAGKQEQIKIALPPGWRLGSDISRRVGTWPMRAMALGGLVLEDVGAERRAKLGLDPSALALGAKHVGQYNEHAAAKRAGFQKDDVVVKVGDIAEKMSESELIGRLLTDRPPGEKVPVTVVRGKDTIELQLPMQ